MSYVYKIVVDGVPRYIGKGTGRRAASHMVKVRSIMRRRAAGEIVRATKFYNKLTKAYRLGADVQIEIVVDGLSDDAAYRFEIEEIAKTNGLWNVTPGGEAPPIATKRSAEFIAKVTASNKATWSNPQLRREQSEQKKIHYLRPEYRKALAGPKDSAHNAKVKARALERWSDPLFRQKMAQVENNPVVRQRRVDGAHRGWVKRRATDK